MSSTITFINHATVLIELNGVNIITDPVYARAVSYFLPRLRPAGIPFERLPSIDCIIISHNHYDHLNMKTLRRLCQKRQSLIVVPKGLGRYARRAGFTDVIEMEWWDIIEKIGVKITCLPAQHFSGRKLWDRNKSVYCGYVIESGDCAVYFAGDTAYADLFKTLSEKFSIDVALLPIGAYKPYEWFKRIHLSPQTALQAFMDLRAKHLVPIHWGTFKISDEPMSEPPILLRQEAERLGISNKVHILNNGESFTW